MTELERIDLIRNRLPQLRGSEVVLGIGDDCAILRPLGNGQDWLISTDLLVEDVHFVPSTHSAGDAGHKALARGLSDIAAMGGDALFALVSLALPSWVEDSWLGAFYDALGALATRAGAAVVGGDLASSKQLVCDVVVCGTVPADTAMRRDTATPGDQLYVSGALGGSALGLATRKGDAWRRHLRPEPRLDLGRWLCAEAGVRTAMDLSDGLSIDLHRLARESGVAVEIDQPVPLFPGATEEQALCGGEDYELVFTAPAGVAIPGTAAGLPLTRIGRILPGPAGEVRLRGQPLAAKGWDHFRAD